MDVVELGVDTANTNRRSVNRKRSKKLTAPSLLFGSTRSTVRMGFSSSSSIPSFLSHDKLPSSDDDDYEDHELRTQIKDIEKQIKKIQQHTQLDKMILQDQMEEDKFRVRIELEKQYGVSVADLEEKEKANHYGDPNEDLMIDLQFAILKNELESEMHELQQENYGLKNEISKLQLDMDDVAHQNYLLEQCNTEAHAKFQNLMKHVVQSQKTQQKLSTELTSLERMAEEIQLECYRLRESDHSEGGEGVADHDALPPPFKKGIICEFPKSPCCLVYEKTIAKIMYEIEVRVKCNGDHKDGILLLDAAMKVIFKKEVLNYRKTLLRAKRASICNLETILDNGDGWNDSRGAEYEANVNKVNGMKVVEKIFETTDLADDQSSTSSVPSFWDDAEDYRTEEQEDPIASSDIDDISSTTSSVPSFWEEEGYDGIGIDSVYDWNCL